MLGKTGANKAIRDCLWNRAWELFNHIAVFVCFPCFPRSMFTWRQQPALCHSLGWGGARDPRHWLACQSIPNWRLWVHILSNSQPAAPFTWWCADSCGWVSLGLVLESVLETSVLGSLALVESFVCIWEGRVCALAEMSFALGMFEAIIFLHESNCWYQRD